MPFKRSTQGLLIVVFCLAFHFDLISQAASAPSFDVTSLTSKADAGDVDAMVQLGKAYWTGSGVATDLEKTKVWLDRAADKGSLDAQVFLGMAYFSGVKVSGNRRIAARYLMEAAQQQGVDASLQSTQALARYYVGMMYRHGEGLEKSDQRAFQFLQLAAAQGSVPAKYDLAIMYDYGLATGADKVHACQLFEEAADQGYVAAMNGAGLCYQRGLGCKKDDGKATAYFTKAAEAGDVRAQGNLAILLGESGQWDKSYFWLRVAESLGTVEDRPAIDKVKTHLTASQVATEDEAVLQWRKAHDTKTH